jgi:hypothetical protein
MAETCMSGFYTHTPIPPSRVLGSGLVSLPSAATSGELTTWKSASGSSITNSREIREALLFIETAFNRPAVDVLNFLQKHPDLITTVADVPAEIACRFGRQTKLSIRVERDEFEEHEDRILMLAATSLTPAAALDLLDDFDRNYLLNLPVNQVQLLRFDVQYI